jgi:hypothetical protein
MEESQMSTKELQEKIVANMRRWQKIENASVASTGRVIEATNNPIVRMIMEIIQRDSQFHYRVQELIADSLERKAIALSTDELADVWELIEKHIELEEKTLELAREALDALKGKKMLVQEYLLNYLMEDETKHNKILAHLEKIKKGAYPYA